MNNVPYPQLIIPNTLAAGPGPGNTDPRVLERFAQCGVADHMQADVLRGMVECKHMLRAVFGTKNIHTFGVAGTGWSGLDAMMSAVLPGDTVVAFVNGTFSSIDGLTLRMKASTADELAENAIDPKPASVTIVELPHGQSVSVEVIESALAKHRPKWAFMAHWETGSGRVNDLQGFSDACERYGSLGLVDAVSSLGVTDFSIDNFPGVVAWASCPQKGICCLPLTYAPVSFSDTYMNVLRSSGTRTFVHHPILEARHWGIVNGSDVEQGTYHRTHSGYAIAAFHEALRLTLEETLSVRAGNYVLHEKALRSALLNLGCKVTSNMTSLVVFNLPDSLSGREMELVQLCRSQGFGIWPTLSEPVQIRIGILNQLNENAIAEIIVRFAEAMHELDGTVDVSTVRGHLREHYNRNANHAA